MGRYIRFKTFTGCVISYANSPPLRILQWPLQITYLDYLKEDKSRRYKSSRLFDIDGFPERRADGRPFMVIGIDKLKSLKYYSYDFTRNLHTYTNKACFLESRTGDRPSHGKMDNLQSLKRYLNYCAGDLCPDTIINDFPQIRMDGQPTHGNLDNLDNLDPNSRPSGPRLSRWLIRTS